MIELDLTQEIRAPVEKVFSYVTDFRRSPEWQSGVSESSQTPDGPTRLGTRFRTVRTFLGQHIEAEGEVTEFVPDQTCAFKSTSGPMKFSMRQTFEQGEGGTSIRLHVEVEGSGIFKVAEHALKNNLAKEFEKQAEKLKAALEA